MSVRLAVQLGQLNGRSGLLIYLLQKLKGKLGVVDRKASPLKFACIIL